MIFELQSTRNSMNEIEKSALSFVSNLFQFDSLSGEYFVIQ